MERLSFADSLFLMRKFSKMLCYRQNGQEGKSYVWQLLPILVIQNCGMRIRQGAEQAHLRMALFVDGGWDQQPRRGKAPPPQYHRPERGGTNPWRLNLRRKWSGTFALRILIDAVQVAMKLHSLKIDDGEEKNSVVSASADLALTVPPWFRGAGIILKYISAEFTSWQ